MSTQRTRYHYMDHLRAHMMLLGVFYHVAPVYMRPRETSDWIFTDPVSHPWLLVMMVMIHLFRMPVFFMVAGFFCALMVDRWGVRYLLRDRFKRIALVFATLVVPLTALCAWITDVGASVAPPPPGRIISFRELTPTYLWFLYLLVYYYALVAFLWWCVPRGLIVAVARWTRSQSLTRLFLYACAGVGVISWWMNEIFVPPPLTWSVNWPIYLYYGCFFIFGMALYRHPGLEAVGFSRLKKLLPMTAATTIACVATLTLRDQYQGRLDTLIEALWCFAYGVAAVAASMAVVSFYQRFFRRETPWGRYIADSAYWVYIAHYPLTLLLPILVYPLPVPPTMKFFLVCAATFALCLVSYHYLVRSTWIGRWLNGKKVPRRSGVQSLSVQKQGDGQDLIGRQSMETDCRH